MSESSLPEINIQPGFLRGESARSARGRWVDGNNVRFVRGRPQKMGGNVAVTDVPVDGIVRGARAWNDLSSRQFIGLGTARKLYAVSTANWTPLDITPDGFTPGFQDPTEMRGFGVGPYGLEPYGTRRMNWFILSDPLHWSLDHFGKLLLAAPLGGTLYSWDPSEFPTPQATPVATAPSEMTGCFVTEERIVICYGVKIGSGDRDLMQFAASAQGTFDNWDYLATSGPNGTPAVTGRLQTGKRIVAGANLGAKLALLWTDAATYTFQYTGSKFVFDRKGVPECGLIGPLAYTVVAGSAYWCSSNTFFQFEGGISKIPNSADIAEWVFKQLRPNYTVKTVCFYNQRYSEVWFLFVFSGQTEPGVYAIYNRDGGFWFTGELERTSAARLDGADSRPILAGIDGILYLHDEGVNDNAAAMPWFIESAPVEIDGGKSSIEVSGFIPDMETQVGDVTITPTGYDRTPANKSAIDTMSKTAAPDEGQVDMRLSGRHIAVRLAGDGLNCDFRLGIPKLEINPAGARR